MRLSKMLPLSIVACCTAFTGCEKASSHNRAPKASSESLSLMVGPDRQKEVDVPAVETSPEVTEGPAPDETIEVDFDEIARNGFDWERASQLVGFERDAAPFLLDRSPKITKTTRRHTRELHRQTAVALGLNPTKDGVDSNLAMFLMTRASIESSDQGNERPLDARGSVHRLDVAAAWKAGARLRKDYVEAGNEFAKSKPHIFLGYGQGGMNSWLFLRSWDILGDPRMLGDTVIFGLTYARVARKKMKMMNGHLKCPAWDDDGRIITTSFNGKKYRVGSRAIDEDEKIECVDKGAEKGEKQGDLESRCARESRSSYRWRPGEDQPPNTVPISHMNWWWLHRATNGRPCPPWKGDEYEEKLRRRFIERASRIGLDVTRRVRMQHLGVEPDVGGQYDLWMTIWDNALVALGEPKANWENLLNYGMEEELSSVAVSPEKIAEDRARAKDPLALEKKWRQATHEKK